MRNKFILAAISIFAASQIAFSQDVRNTYIAVAAQIADNVITLAKLNGLGTGVATALGIAVGSAGGPVTFNGAGGTPSSMTATNLSGTAASLTAGNVTTNAAIPYFAVNLSAGQTMTTGSGPNKVNFNTELADSNGWYDNATNYRFTPLTAGKYRIHMQMECTGTSITTCAGYLYKNGANYARSLNQPTATGFLGVGVDAVISFNGSTDYVEGFALITCTGTCQVNGGTAPIVSWIEGQFISP